MRFSYLLAAIDTEIIMNFITHFGRIVSIPTLVLIFVINYSKIINLSSFDFGVLMSFTLLFAFATFFLLLTKNYYKFNQRIFLILFCISILLFQNLLTSGLHNYLTSSEDFDMMNDLSFVVIIPILILSVQTWGWLFDRTKNNSKQDKKTSS
jgi:hypothetical protein